MDEFLPRGPRDPEDSGPELWMFFVGMSKHHKDTQKNKKEMHYDLKQLQSEAETR